MSLLTHVAGSVRAVPLALFGLPSIQEIVEGIANGFGQALAGALVPAFLKHATVGTIQWLVALPDPESWTHVRHLQEEMTWLGISLLPVTLSVGTIRYWAAGVTGSGHPASILTRTAGCCGVLVAYPWIVSQTVAGTNTMTHAILGFPEVANGLASLVSVLFGGALLVGAGSAFAAVLVIVGVVFAGALFAFQAVLVDLLALLAVCGPPLIAVSPIPELSALGRLWGRAVGVVALIPIAWTVLFAVAGALTLDATDVAGGAGGLPGHITAAFGALATWILAVKLPLMLLGELRGFLVGGMRRGGTGGGGGAGAASGMPGAQRLQMAQMRLRAASFDGVPALAGSVGLAAGALGAPQGGPIGALRRKMGAAGETTQGAPESASAAGRDATAAPRRGGGARARIGEAGRMLAQAPARARVATVESVAAQLEAQKRGAKREQSRGSRTGGGGSSVAGAAGTGAQAGSSSGPRSGGAKVKARPAGTGDHAVAEKLAGANPGATHGRAGANGPGASARGPASSGSDAKGVQARPEARAPQGGGAPEAGPREPASAGKAADGAERQPRQPKAQGDRRTAISGPSRTARAQPSGRKPQPPRKQVKPKQARPDGGGQPRLGDEQKQPRPRPTPAPGEPTERDRPRP